MPYRWEARQLPSAWAGEVPNEHVSCSMSRLLTKQSLLWLWLTPTYLSWIPWAGITSAAKIACRPGKSQDIGWVFDWSPTWSCFCHSSTSVSAQAGEKRRILKSLRVEKTSEIPKFNPSPPHCALWSHPSVPHLHSSWTPPGMVTPPSPWAAVPLHRCSLCEEVPISNLKERARENLSYILVSTGCSSRSTHLCRWSRLGMRRPTRVPRPQIRSN